MNCSIENISDEKLKILIGKHGVDNGMKMFMDEYSLLIDSYDNADPIPGKTVISLIKSLDARNTNDSTAHLLSVLKNGKEIDHSQINDNDRYTTEIRLGWGKSITDNAKYYSEGFTGDVMFDDDGYMDEDFGSDLTEDFDPDFSDLGSEMDEDVRFMIDDSLLDLSPDDFDEYMFGNERIKYLNATQKRVLNAVKATRVNTDKIRNSIHRLRNTKESIDREIAAAEARNAPDEEIDKLFKRAVLVMHRINDFKSELENIQANYVAASKSSEIDGLRELYASHMRFLRVVTSQEYPLDIDLRLAEDIISMWSTMYTLMVDDMGDIEPALEDLLTEINSETSGKLKNDIIRKLKNRVMNDHSKYINRAVSEAELTYGKDVNSFIAGGMALSDTRIPILHMLGSLISRMKSLINNEEISVLKKIETMFKKIGNNYSDFLEYDSDGNFTGNRVGRYNQNYYIEKESIMSAFADAVKSAAKFKHSKDSAEKKQRNEILKKAIEVKNRNLRSSHIIIDPSKLDDDSTIREQIDLIANETGDREFAEEMVSSAVEKWNKYKRDVTVFTAFTNDLYTSGRIGDDERKAKLESFSRYNNPSFFYEHVNKTSLTNSDIVIVYDSPYAVMVPRVKYSTSKKETGFYSSKYKSIMADSDKAKFYNEFNDLMLNMLSYLPNEYAGKLNSSFLPNVERDFWKKMSKKGMNGIMSGIRDEIVNSVTSSNLTDSQYGRRDEKGRLIRKIPVRFIREIPSDDKSTDLKAVITEFSRMAIGYKYAAMVEDKVAVEMKVLEAMKAANVSRSGEVIKNSNGDVDSSSARLERAIKMAQHFVDMNLYGSSKDLEGFSNFKFFDSKKTSIRIRGSVNPMPILKEFEDLKSKHGPEEASRKIKEAYPENVEIVTEKQAYNDLREKLDKIDDDLYAKKISKEEHRVKTLEVESEMAKLGKNNVVSKWIDKVISFGAYKAFAWNPFPVITNQAFGVITIMNHAQGGEDFSVQDAISGLSSASMSSMSIIKAGNADNDKIYNLSKKFRVIADISEGQSNESVGLKRLFGPFGPLSSSDYINRAAVMVAVLKSTKINDKNGVQRSLIEAYKNDGSWNSAEFGENSDWNIGDIGENSGKAHFKLEAKIRKLNRRLHGNMEKETSAMAKRNAIGRLLAQYRLSWMAEGIALRFEGRRFDPELEREIEGRYNTGFNYFLDNGVTGSLITMLKLMSFQGNASFDGMRLRGGDRELVIANMRKNFHELFTWCALMGVYFLISASFDDDDEDKGAKYMIINSLNRIMGDITFYISPMTFNQIINNPIPATSILEDAYRLQKSIVKHLNGEEYYDREVLLRNFSRNFPGLSVYNKILYRTERELLNQ